MVPLAMALVLHLTSVDPVQVEQRLADLHFDPGAVDGQFTQETYTALWGLQKLNGLEPVSELNTATLAALQRPRPVRPLVRRGAADRVEVDLSRQLMFVYDSGKLALITHVSTGTGRRYCVKGRCGYAITRPGDFTVQSRVRRWHTGRLGAMYKPLYFNGGIAMHGSVRVPRRPASHGCVRVPLYSADRLFRLVGMGEPVHIRR